MELVSRDCPVCLSSIHVTLSDNGTYRRVREFKDNIDSPIAVKCVKCGMVYLNPLMSDEEYEVFYNNDEQKKFVSTMTKESEMSYQKKISKDDEARAKLVLEFVGSSDSILDVGIGFSNFVGLMRNAVGIDISKPRVADANARGLDVKLCSIEDWNKREDVVTMFHVLEHIPEPYAFLKEAHRVLNKGGKLVIEVPSHGDILTNLGAYKDFYFQNAHCSYFSLKTLKRLVESSGFNVVNTEMLQRYSVDSHLHWLINGKPGKIKVPPVINKIYSYVLKKIKLSDTIFLVCEKR